MSRWDWVDKSLSDLLIRGLQEIQAMVLKLIDISIYYGIIRVRLPLFKPFQVCVAQMMPVVESFKSFNS